MRIGAWRREPPRHPAHAARRGLAVASPREEHCHGSGSRIHTAFREKVAFQKKSARTSRRPGPVPDGSEVPNAADRSRAWVPGYCRTRISGLWLWTSPKRADDRGTLEWALFERAHRPGQPMARACRVGELLELGLERPQLNKNFSAVQGFRTVRRGIYPLT